MCTDGDPLHFLYAPTAPMPLLNGVLANEFTAPLRHSFTELVTVVEAKLHAIEEEGEAQMLSLQS